MLRLGKGRNHGLGSTFFIQHDAVNIFNGGKGWNTWLPPGAVQGNAHRAGGALHSQGKRISCVGPTEACLSGDSESPATPALPHVVTLLSFLWLMDTAFSGPLTVVHILKSLSLLCHNLALVSECSWCCCFNIWISFNLWNMQDFKKTKCTHIHMYTHALLCGFQGLNFEK